MALTEHANIGSLETRGARGRLADIHEAVVRPLPWARAANGRRVRPRAVHTQVPLVPLARALIHRQSGLRRHPGYPERDGTSDGLTVNLDS